MGPSGNHSRVPVVTLVALLALVLYPTLATSQSVGEPGRGSGQPNPLKNVYFGEPHMHTRN